MHEQYGRLLLTYFHAKSVIRNGLYGGYYLRIGKYKKIAVMIIICNEITFKLAYVSDFTAS